MKKIISKNNELIKTLKKQKAKNRFLLFLDNPKTINEAINLNLKLNYVLIEESKLNNFNKFKNYEQLLVVSEEVIKEFTNVITPQGIIAVFEYFPKTLQKPTSNFLVLDNVQDAGNVGTLLRSALGADFKDVFLINCAKITSEKVVRSSMGAILKLNIFEVSKQEFIAFCKQNKLNLVCADMEGKNIFETNLNSNVGVVLGNEGNGVSDEIKSLCTQTITIPMKNNLESLNVGVAGSIIMFEISKKRKLDYEWT